MADVIIRPTLKFIRFGYIVMLAIIAAAVVAWAILLNAEYPLLLIAPLLLMLIPLNRHLRRNTTRATISGDRLRYETGILSKSTRTIQLSKVQDVRVDQRLGQRIFGVGNLSIETAGETSRLTIENIDSPQTVADDIIAAAHRGQIQGQGQGQGQGA